MNIEKSYFRTWCKTCNDWEVFVCPHLFEKAESEYTCKQCSKPIEGTMLGEIPKEKILEQRKRYKEQKSRNFRDMLYAFSTLGGSGSMLGDRERIIENDAGQKSIDEERVKREKEEEEAFRIERFKYVNLQRNEICKCGSNLKYKKCCWVKYHG